ncbi:transposase [Ktedonobacter sp. SOSP1-85]|uniref:RNA-guided endonuclease InsQ/TnpB family protein n=1 Tax=Ktedonobacter sp. SOSP1-85 TaxID=2778367 RepID=UPI001916B2CA|nr:RNA-guided endonuclease TnpB family protein [Ktedonobacter sp. SOSP1-85]GHO78183.1 transposase [Ktedonobacter sp. SOSP1-85]
MRIQLQTTGEQARALQETLAQFTLAYNHVCAYGWHQGEKNGVRLHHATYYQTKALCPGLVSDLLIQARVKATETLRSAFTWKAKKEAASSKKAARAQQQGKPAPPFKPVRCPCSQHCAVRYNIHTYTLDWASQTVRLSTTQGKMSLAFTVPHFSERYRGCKIATADLLCCNGRWWLHVVVNVPEPVVPPHPEVIGVDLGLNRPAVTSTRHFLGTRRWKEIDRRTFRLKRKLQSNGSKSAKRHLKKLARKQMRFHRDCDHVLSKHLVQQAAPGSTMVLENLTNLREGVRHRKGEGQRRLHTWSFAQLYGFIAYKAQERGIVVERVDPRHTSQTCSRCGHQERNNRRSQSLFHCRFCGYQLNADLNAAINIRDKYCLAQNGRPVLSGPLSDGLSSQASA